MLLGPDSRLIENSWMVHWFRDTSNEGKTNQKKRMKVSCYHKY